MSCKANRLETRLILLPFPLALFSITNRVTLHLISWGPLYLETMGEDPTHCPMRKELREGNREEEIRELSSKLRPVKLGPRANQVMLVD